MLIDGNADGAINGLVNGLDEGRSIGDSSLSPMQSSLHVTGQAELTSGLWHLMGVLFNPAQVHVLIWVVKPSILKTGKLSIESTQIMVLLFEELLDADMDGDLDVDVDVDLDGLNEGLLLGAGEVLVGAWEG